MVSKAVKSFAFILGLQLLAIALGMLMVPGM